MTDTGSPTRCTPKRAARTGSRWITRGAETKPDRSVVLVAATQAEAEERAQQWAEHGR